MPGEMAVAARSPSAETESLEALFQDTFRERTSSIEALRSDGSSRRLFRMRSDSRSVVGVCHDRADENAAFVGFTRHFRALGFPVPEISAEDLPRGVYIETDLGDDTLALLIRRARGEGRFPEAVLSPYREAVRWLVRFQTIGAAGLDLSLCYQGSEFDGEAMERDLAYFRACFLDLLSPVPYDAASLEKDFRSIVALLAAEERPCFLYRDFQSRNVMIQGGEVRFIDYQSGRMGAPHYDLASLLYDARADLGGPLRAELTDLYVSELGRRASFDHERFPALLSAFALLRVLQALGAYGNLGVRHGKSRFLKSVPYGIANARSILGDPSFPLPLHELRRVVDRLGESPLAERRPEP
ncbi:MAG: hypothetical protein EHM19_01100 [Candidatus Latescibacterota bacterium]|nr:MAG: hypothetical protein EHM19_01100 [Candidatus Latescibacterota bacterium]